MARDDLASKKTGLRGICCYNIVLGILLRPGVIRDDLLQGGVIKLTDSVPDGALNLSTRIGIRVLRTVLALYLAFAFVASIFIFLVLLGSPIAALAGSAGTAEIVIAELELIFCIGLVLACLLLSR